MVFFIFLEKQPSQMQFQAIEKLGNLFKMKTLIRYTYIIFNNYKQGS